MMPANLLDSQVPPGQLQAGQGQQYPSRLCNVAQKLFFRLIHLLDRLIFHGKVPKNLTADMIVLELPDYRPKLKLTVADLSVDANPDAIDSLLGDLGGILKDLIR
jgi:hypothetical protein